MICARVTPYYAELAILYDDGIKKKNNMVVAVVVESFGGIGTRAPVWTIYR